MAVVEFGAAALTTTVTHTSANPKVPTNLSSFSTGAVTQVVNVVNVTTASVQYYKRGYYVTTQTFEYWRTTLRDGSPPSGNPLVDITVLGEVREF